MDFLNIIYSILAFIVAIGVLVTVHEFGHFWVARKLGVKVLRFSVGFGKPLWRRRAGADDTEYVIAALPLGGYVKMLDEREGDVDPADLDRAFNRQPVGSRIAIVAAGPVFNFLFAIFAYYVVFLVGIGGVKPLIGDVDPSSPAQSAGVQSGDLILAVNDVDTVSWERARFAMLDQAVGAETLTLRLQGKNLQIREASIDLRGMELLKSERIDLMRDLGLHPWRPDIPPVIAEVVAGGAAEAAGMLAGDRVLSLDDREIANLRIWVDTIRDNPGKTMRLIVERDGVDTELALTPRLQQQGELSYGYIGVRNRVEIPEAIRREMTVVERFGPIEGLQQSLEKTWGMTWLTLRVLGKLVTGEASVRNLSGPITIAHYAGLSAQIGLEPFLGFLAIISISLGVLNLLPVPMLDGGHLLYYLIEIVKGRPVSEKTEMIGQKIGLTLLFGLMSVAIYNDLLRLVS